MDITISLKVPGYLKQWAIFQFGGDPVRFPRGSAYTKLLRVFLRSKRECESVALPCKDDLLVFVPTFPGRDPAVYNYLPKKASGSLCELIRDAFDLQLYKDLGSFNKAYRKGDELISAWMEEHGIDVSDTNWTAVAKRLQLLRRRAYDRDRKRSAYQKSKNQHSQCSPE